MEPHTIHILLGFGFYAFFAVAAHGFLSKIMDTPEVKEIVRESGHTEDAVNFGLNILALFWPAVLLFIMFIVLKTWLFPPMKPPPPPSPPENQPVDPLENQVNKPLDTPPENP